MNTNFAERIFRVSFILVFIGGMIVMPSTRATAQSPCPSSMVSYWRADADATDSIDGNDGILNGATYLAGRVGLSFATNVNQYITVPDSPNLHIPQNITIEAWVNPSTSVGDRVILSKGNSNVGDGWHMMLRQNNTLAVHARYGTAWEITETSETIPVGTWHHVVYTYDGSQARLYIDGVEKALRPFTAPIQQNSRPFKIGTVDQNIAFFAGLIDEVAIYRSVLSESELNEHYQSGMAGASYCSIPSELYNPWLEIWYPEDRIQVVDWPLNTTVSVTIDNDFDVNNGVLFENDYERGNQERIYIELDGIFDIQPGQVITVVDTNFTRFHQVTSLVVAGWDIAADTVFGSAAPNSFVQIHASNDGGINWAWRSTIANGSGNWVFDFSKSGTEPGEEDLLDVKSGTLAAATQPGLLPDDGGQTHFAFTVGQTIPVGTSLTTPSHGTVTSGTPTVFMNDPLTVSTTGCSGGMATATLTGLDEPGYVQLITLAETPPASGTYIGTFAPVLTYHGLASISIAINGCSPETTITFDLYIDPSGVVRDTLGNPLVGATVMLYRSDDPGGPFVAVPEGSTIMSPGNRTNPDLTGVGGLFGWDVVAGFYVVRAEKAGCFSPTDPSQAFVESAVMTIPPAVTDLELILKCQEPPLASAGGPYTVEWGAMLTLDGSGSTDPNNNIASYQWDLDGDGGYDDASGMTITTSFRHFGEQTIGLRVTDNGGLSDTDTATVTVLPWMLKGFYPPVDMNDVYNIVKKGSTVPFKFEIFAGFAELTDIAHVKSITSAQTSCNAAATTDDIETTGAGGTSLRYDAAAGQFVYNWKMPNTAGKCYRVTMTTVDGSSLVAYFKLK